MTPRKKATPQRKLAWAQFDKTSKQQTEVLMKLLEDARHYRAQYDQLMVEVQQVSTTLDLALRVFTDTLAEQYPVDVLPSAKKGE